LRRVLHFALLAAILAGLAAGAAPRANGTPQAEASQQAQRALRTPAGSSLASPSAKHVSAYTLPPDLYRKARDFNRIGYRLYFLGSLYSLLALWIILRVGVGVGMRNLAGGITQNRAAQAMIFTPMLLALLGVLELPVELYGHHVSLAYGISVQAWGSWFWDWTKGELLGFLLGSVLVMILYAAIRRSPRMWWMYFWLATLPIILILTFLQPLLVDPLFHKFEPLEASDAPLVEALEHVVARAGMHIPPERMFLMVASEKTNALNAYVTGLGGSKRVVVYDTTIQKMTTPQIAYVFGHEMGHYVLNHIWKGLVFGGLLAFAFFYITFHLAGWLLRRHGTAWGIRGMEDLASLPLLLLLISSLVFVGTPIINGFSRHLEHQADQYGLEVTHGLNAAAGQTAAQSFQVLGEQDLSDPDPPRFVIFWLYDHPPNGDRIRFCLEYDPWKAGSSPEFVK
jgi:STE24 endopeptidase